VGDACVQARESLRSLLSWVGLVKLITGSARTGVHIAARTEAEAVRFELTPAALHPAQARRMSAQ
jgi:hypothetical protein